MKRIVTHSEPDADAIAAAWLAETFLFPGEDVEVVFVPRPRPGQPLPAADCLVDIACVNDPKRLIFDHKPPAFADRNTTCAARLVWELLQSLGRPVAHLEALVRVVHEGDRSPPGRPSPELARSRAEGFHFRLKQARARGDGDLVLYQVMRGYLDRYDRDERARRGHVRTLRPNEARTIRADLKPPGVGARVGDPQAATSMPPGEVRTKRTARDLPSVIADPPPSPNPQTGDDGLRALEALLLKYGSLCQGDEAPGPAADADRAGWVAAIRG